MPSGDVEGSSEVIQLAAEIGDANVIGRNPDNDHFFGDFAGSRCFVYVARMDHKAYVGGRKHGRWCRVSPVYEISLVPERTVVATVALHRPAANSDDDGDGVPYSVELDNMTDPYKADTDGDGVGDHAEIYGMNITLNLPSGAVIVNTLGIDPWLVDSDDDGVLDGVEVYGLAPYGFVTDPNNPDTDGDGVIDGLDPNPLGATDANGDGIADEWLAFWTNQVALWGYDAGMRAALLDPDGDADGDGISNRQEYQQGTVPIVANGHCDARVVPAPLVITAAPNALVTAAFAVVDLSWRPCTGTVLQLSQPWAGNPELRFTNYKLQFGSSEETRFCARFGVRVPCWLPIDTTNLCADTVYHDVLRVVVGGCTSRCDVLLYVSPGAQPNHAPAGCTLLAPADGTRLIDVCNQPLQWTAAEDADGDAITYDVYCGWSYGDEAPPLLVAGHSGTQLVAFDPEAAGADAVLSNRVYCWQVVAKDGRGGQCWSPVWRFSTPVPDADHDGLLDDDEDALGTNKNDPDSDDDGVRDGEEYYRGANPLDRFDRPVAIELRALPPATVGYAYRGELQAGWGAPGYGWDMAQGWLPAGLTLTAGGAITGMPVQTGLRTFTVRVRDQRDDTTVTNMQLEVQARGTGSAGTVGHGVLGHGMIGAP
jgi:hypothetical protein